MQVLATTSTPETSEASDAPITTEEMAVFAKMVDALKSQREVKRLLECMGLDGKCLGVQFFSVQLKAKHRFDTSKLSPRVLRANLKKLQLDSS
jgi:hypothetical protein